jgi:hypothetical protein
MGKIVPDSERRALVLWTNPVKKLKPNAGNAQRYLPIAANFAKLAVGSLLPPAFPP